MSEKNYIERYWRDAKPEDAIKDPPMVARFRDSKDRELYTSIWTAPIHLTGLDRKNELCWGDGENWWRFCQVYDAPDPGDGYELIDITKATKQSGDEYLLAGLWVLVDGHPFRDFEHYRRRITPTATYVPFTWEDREQLRGRWVYRDKDGYVLEEVAFKFDSRAFDVVAKHLLDDGWKFIDTKKPVGKEVIQ